MKLTIKTVVIILLAAITGCQTQGEKSIQQPANDAEGKLYIIGGGKRPAEMVQEIIDLSGIGQEGYAIILPMSSIEPDTSFFYAKRQFTKLGAKHIFNFQVFPNELIGQEKLDSIISANLIYIPGGEQARFMEVVLNTPVHEAIKTAYQNGAVIAGTSAGAAVMSTKMITGNEFKHPKYTGDFRTIEAENMELKEGLGLLESSIIDQHFIWRMRMNRLMSVAIENPNYTCIGIDESTAITVEGDSAKVSGISQVVLIKNHNKEIKSMDGLLGAEGMDLSVYLPGDKFSVK